MNHRLKFVLPLAIVLLAGCHQGNVEPAPDAQVSSVVPTLQIDQVVVPTNAQDPISISVRLNSNALSPIAFTQDQFTTVILKADGSTHWSGSLEFPTDSTNVLVARPGTPLVVSLKLREVSRLTHRRWSELSPGRYLLKVVADLGNTRRFENLHLGQCLSPSVALDIPKARGSYDPDCVETL